MPPEIATLDSARSRMEAAPRWISLTHWLPTTPPLGFRPGAELAPLWLISVVFRLLAMGQAASWLAPMVLSFHLGTIKTLALDCRLHLSSCSSYDQAPY